tara:strand:+ start:316 stop:525 length:210 start_codon:yes stop_codon:yes gene_type:complete
MKQYGYQGDDGIGEALGIDHWPGHDCPSCGHETPYMAGEDGDYYDYICENADCGARARHTEKGDAHVKD